MITRPRSMPDGSLQYPNRGLAPPVPEGYERDQSDPFRLVPILPDCQHRFRGETKLACGKLIVFYECMKGFKCGHPQCRACIASGMNEP